MWHSEPSHLKAGSAVVYVMLFVTAPVHQLYLNSIYGTRACVGFRL